MKPELDLNYGTHSIFLSTCGKNEDEGPVELVRFLKYVGAGLEESTADFRDEFVRRLQTTVRNIKTNREMGERYMVLHEMLREEREEGRAERVHI